MTVLRPLCLPDGRIHFREVFLPCITASTITCPVSCLGAEQPELIGLIAPRHLFVESGENDPIFPVENVREAIAELKEIYNGMNALDCFQSDLFPGSHEISGRKSFDWLAECLRS